MVMAFRREPIEPSTMPLSFRFGVAELDILIYDAVTTRHEVAQMLRYAADHYADGSEKYDAQLTERDRRLPMMRMIVSTQSCGESPSLAS